MVTNTLSIFLPGLLHLPAEAPPLAAAPALTGLLARAERTALADAGLRAGLAAAAGFGAEAAERLPLAALGALDEGLQPGAAQDWLTADPVHLRADMDRVVLLPPEQLALDGTERAQLADAVREVLSESGGEIRVSDSGRFYISGFELDDVRLADLDRVAGRDILAFMPAGRRAGALRTLLNAIQMSLHEHPLNRARAARGEFEANALWLWGGGCLADMPARPMADVWSDAPWARGLAVHAGVQAHPLPSGLDGVTGTGVSAALVVIEAAGKPAAAGDPESWQAVVETIDAGWIAPAMAALARGRFASVRLVAGDGHAYTLTRFGALRFWRRRRPLTEFLR